MEVGSLYNTSIKLKKGDKFFVKDKKFYINPKNIKNRVYVSHVFDLNNLEKEILVNSDGLLPRDKENYEGFDWKVYIPK